MIAPNVNAPHVIAPHVIAPHRRRRPPRDPNKKSEKNDKSCEHGDTILGVIREGRRKNKTRVVL